jgi:hypothetical protein
MHGDVRSRPSTFYKRGYMGLEGFRSMAIFRIQYKLDREGIEFQSSFFLDKERYEKFIGYF